jgi:dolichol-phosphate mannosyltransferase
MSALLRIVIPAHNEEARIRPTLQDYCRHFGDRATIIVVANGCSDGTTDVVRELQKEYPSVRLIDIPALVGKGGAIRVGFKTGAELFVGFVDADGSTSAEEFERLFDWLAVDEGCAGVIGSRWLPQSVLLPPQPLSRRVASRSFNFIVKLFFGLPYHDTQCGAKVFRRAAVTAILERLELKNFAFDIDLLYWLKRTKQTVREVPTLWSDRLDGTKIHLVRSSRSMLSAVLRLRLKNSRFATWPFIERLSRSDVLPVRSRVCLLVVAQTPEPELRADSLLASLASDWRRGGHIVEWQVAPRNPGEYMRFLGRYLVRHRHFDSLIDATRDGGAWLWPFSPRRAIRIEPSLVLSETTRRGVPDFSAPPYEAHFEETPQGWCLHYTHPETRVPKIHVLE